MLAHQNFFGMLEWINLKLLEFYKRIGEGFLTFVKANFNYGNTITCSVITYKQSSKITVRIQIRSEIACSGTRNKISLFWKCVLTYNCSSNVKVKLLFKMTYKMMILINFYLKNDWNKEVAFKMLKKNCNLPES